jgi:hypothetical protein
MKIIAIAAVAAGLAASGALGWATPAAAEPILGASADVVVKHLQDQGYNVQFNMPSGMQLSRCTVSGINGLTVMMTPDGSLMMMMMAPNSIAGVVTVDLACPDSNN